MSALLLPHPYSGGGLPTNALATSFLESTVELLHATTLNPPGQVATTPQPSVLIASPSGTASVCFACSSIVLPPPASMTTSMTAKVSHTKMQKKCSSGSRTPFREHMKQRKTSSYKRYPSGSGKKARTSKPTTALLLKPLTAYNYFFRDERDNIVDNHNDDDDDCHLIKV